MKKQGRWVLGCLVFVACSSPRGRAQDGGGGRGGGTGGQGGGLGGRGGGSSNDAADERGRGNACTMGGATVGFPVSEFRTPVEHCRWDRYTNVMSTPAVVDLDGDGKPEVVFVSMSQTVAAISGIDCKTVWETPYNAEICATCDVAVGDLDGDGRPEVVAPSRTGIVVYGADGGLLATAPPSGYVLRGWVAPSIANLDGKGTAEVVVGSSAFHYEGGAVSLLWMGEDGEESHSAPAIADLDGDGKPEVVMGQRVRDGATGAIRLEYKDRIWGMTAVVDFDPGSPGPEIVHVGASQGQTQVMAGLASPTPGKVLFGPYANSDSAAMGLLGGGAPAVANFDDDPEPEIGVASGSSYRVFDRECAATPLPDKCQAPGISWTARVQDESSAVTTSTVFDFNCDGKAEVVYRDECWLRVFEGATGKVLFATTMTSNTAIEGAVVADTDGTGHAKIVIAANDVSRYHCPQPGELEAATKTPFEGAKSGLYILRDPMDRWSPTRKIWNQNAYHVTNVEDDGRIPLVESPSWTTENTYRANVILPP